MDNFRSNLRAFLFLGAVLLMPPAAGQARSKSGAPILLKRKIATKLLVHEIKPDYPAIAKVNYVQGKVRLLLSVSPQGKVTQAHIVEGHPLLAQAALEAVHQWVYLPFVTKSGPSEFETFVNVRFSLQVKRVSDIPPNSVEYYDRNVHPARALTATSAIPSPGTLRLRLLISDAGRVLDSRLLSGPYSQLASARKDVEAWKFEPARWGNQTVPSYLDVSVPVETDPVLKGDTKGP